MEFVSLKKNYMQLITKHEEQQSKNQNLGVELINLVNENKMMNKESNELSKKHENLSIEQIENLRRLERFEADNQNQKEALIMAKAEIERLKTKMIEYDLKDQQYKIELDSKKIEMERGFMQMTKEQQNELQKLGLDADTKLGKREEQQRLWQSEKVELIHKNKSLQRKIGDVEEQLQVLGKQVDEQATDNSKITIQMDEMRSIYRGKLMQFMNSMSAGNKPTLGYDLNAREELIRTYTEKEVDLAEKQERAKHETKQLKLELKALKGWALQVKYLAEDWAPVGVPLPDVLARPPPTRISEDMMTEQGRRDHEEAS